MTEMPERLHMKKNQKRSIHISALSLAKDILGNHRSRILDNGSNIISSMVKVTIKKEIGTILTS